MNLNTLFGTIDGLIGDVSTFNGLSFEFEHGFLTVDTIELDDVMFVCDFISKDANVEPTSFAAKGLDELKDQIAHFVLL